MLTLRTLLVMILVIVAHGGLINAMPLRPQQGGQELATQEKMELNFYVSSQAGNNTHHIGTDPMEPWLTLAFASQRIKIALENIGPAAGPSLFVTIALECNSTFLNDPLIVDAKIRRTGASLRITQYNCSGNGFQPVPLRAAPAPLLQMARTMTARDPCLNVSNVAGTNATAHNPSKQGTLIIEGLQFSGCHTGILVTSQPASPPQEGQSVQHRENGQPIVPQGNNIVIRGNTFTDMHQAFLRYSPADPRWATAVIPGGRFENFTIENNIAARVDTFLNSLATIENFYVHSNTVQQCGGNCVGMGSSHDSLVQNNVFNRDISERLFMYGTTDIIIGDMTGHNVVSGNDFNQRGEYVGGPDGCAFDFEDSASGFEVSDNIFYKSYGSGIMILGHPSIGTSQNITLSGNTFFECGCQQTGGDSSAIAVMCGGGRPSGLVKDTTIYTCQGPNANPPISVAPVPVNCSGLLKFENTKINPEFTSMVEKPSIFFWPPAPTCDLSQSTYPVFGSTRTNGATIRYTLDGSRPNETSPIFPTYGLNLTWPGAVVNLNLKAFKEGYLPSVTEGTVIELNYNLCRGVPPVAVEGPNAQIFQVGIQGNLDSVKVERLPGGTGNAEDGGMLVLVSGWAVDQVLPGGGWDPVTVMILVDAAPVVSTLATAPHPDVVKGKYPAAPNMEHGFHMIPLPLTAVMKLLSPGVHILSVRAIGSPNSMAPTPLNGRSEVSCIDGECLS